MEIVYNVWLIIFLILSQIHAIFFATSINVLFVVLTIIVIPAAVI
jgi:hypothetical protein